MNDEQSKTYNSWSAMKQRCRNPKSVKFAKYGAVGINYGPRWESFENFLADMGARPEGMTLDRIDNGGQYSSENCRWATPSQQMNNRAACVIVAYQGRDWTMMELSRHLGLKWGTLKYRVEQNWPDNLLGGKPSGQPLGFRQV